MKLLDYLYLLLLLLKGRGELESLLRKALLRSVLGRAKLRQHYKEEKRKAGQSKVWRLPGLEKDNTENEIEKLSVWLIFSIKSQTFQNKFSLLLVEGISCTQKGTKALNTVCIPSCISKCYLESFVAKCKIQDVILKYN